MRELAIDIETYSSADIRRCGVYRYVEAPDFMVLLIAYAIDRGPVRICDLASGETLPDEVRAALTDPTVTKTAFNATFERVCLSRWLGLPAPMSARGWDCTMALAARCGFPMSLGECARVLGLAEGKMAEGRALIQKFSRPNRSGTRNRGENPKFAADWATFRRYCVRDVEVEQAIRARLEAVNPPTPGERRVYEADAEINDRGIRVCLPLVRNAAALDEDYRSRLVSRARELTGLDNPASPSQIKGYISERCAVDIDSLTKGSVRSVRARLQGHDDALALLDLRAELAKTSNAKYRAMLEAVCADGRLHGLMQYHGTRTGRWAGRLVQVQNLPQNHLPDLDRARALVLAGDLDELALMYPRPTDTLSELVRTALTASPGRTLHVCDFSAIEARVVAWLAGEGWVLDVFRDGGDIYCATASQMFGVPVEKHGPNSELRAKGKVAVLALGYGGGEAALAAMGADRMGLDEAERRRIVKLWRRANPRIVALWRTLSRLAVATLRSRARHEGPRGVYMDVSRGVLRVTLPSGRRICYPRAAIESDAPDLHEADTITYEGVSQITRQWTSQRTYGGKLTENVVQAIARDILAEVLLRARDAGMDVVAHVHDEIIVDAPPTVTLDAVASLFDTPPLWAPGLPLRGAGYSTPYYLKD